MSSSFSCLNITRSFLSPTLNRSHCSIMHVCAFVLFSNRSEMKGMLLYIFCADADVAECVGWRQRFVELKMFIQCDIFKND